MYFFVRDVIFLYIHDTASVHNNDILRYVGLIMDLVAEREILYREWKRICTVGYMKICFFRVEGHFVIWHGVVSVSSNDILWYVGLSMIGYVNVTRWCGEMTFFAHDVHFFEHDEVKKGLNTFNPPGSADCICVHHLSSSALLFFSSPCVLFSNWQISQMVNNLFIPPFSPMNLWNGRINPHWGHSFTLNGSRGLNDIIYTNKHNFNF